ncbi:MAG: carboxypeptidase-like regulatory domain-containing protein [Prolixibacteraceae bacterium]|nr:carboxypeptidase-like regulatory domain-containing protein [Prolixibacteraceae bacterium]
MKNYCFFFTILFSLSINITFAQLASVEGIVVSENDRDSLAYTQIMIKGKNTNTITNSEGYFILLGNFTLCDSILIRHIAYEPKTIIISELKEHKTIKLTPKTFTIDEVTIHGNSALDQLKEALSISKANLKLPFRLETYYREFVKENNKYTKFSDGLIDYDLSGEAVDPKTKVFVKQSRANELNTEADKEIDWNLNSPLDIEKMISPFFLNAISKIIENADKYEFHVGSKAEKNIKGQVQITFTPKENIKELLLQGKIIIDEQSKYILSCSYSLEQNDSKTPKITNMIVLKAQLLQQEIFALFLVNNGIYQPWYISKRAEIRMWNNKKLNVTFGFSSDLLVNKFVNESPDAHPFKSNYTKKSLYPLGNNYQSAFWERQNAIQLTSEEKKVIELLK